MQKTIKTEQIEIAKAMAKDFMENADGYSYQGEMGPDGYCNLIGLDYDTVRLLGPVSYTISYQVTAEDKYQLACVTYINGIMNEKLSVSLEGDTDFMGFNTKASDNNCDKQSYYQKRKAEVREEAIEYSYSEEELSYGELADRQDYFRRLGKRYGLLREFKENCIC